jgi:sulfur relay (sulfurtransferase) DsrF/TusC family protein
MIGLNHSGAFLLVHEKRRNRVTPENMESTIVFWRNYGINARPQVKEIMVARKLQRRSAIAKCPLIDAQSEVIPTTVLGTIRQIGTPQFHKPC